MPSSPGEGLLGKGLWTSMSARPEDTEPLQVNALTQRRVEPPALAPVLPQPAPRGFEDDLLSEVEWPELPAALGAADRADPAPPAPAETAAAGSDGAVEAIPDEPQALEPVVEGSVAGFDDEELPEVESEEGDPNAELGEAPADPPEAPSAPPGLPAPQVAASALPPILRNKVLWIVAAFLAGVVLMTLHILLPRPAADLQPDRSVRQKGPESDLRR
jgi:hypothetical protein